MRITVLDVSGREEFLITPKGVAEDFLRWLLTTNSWKEHPEVLYDKAVRVRKTLIEQGERKPIPPSHKPAS